MSPSARREPVRPWTGLARLVIHVLARFLRVCFLVFCGLAPPYQPPTFRDDDPPAEVADDARE